MAENSENTPLSGAQKVNELFQALLAKQPKGFATSSMGKFDPFRKWLAQELGLGDDWKSKTYAVGSAGIAHNFGSRWAQNNTISGSRLPLGAAFLSVPNDADEDKLVANALNTSAKFVDGSRPTSFEAIIVFVQSKGQPDLKAHAILSSPDSDVADRLLKLFPGIPVTSVEPKAGLPQPSATPVPKSVVPLENDFDSSLLQALEEGFVEAKYRAPKGLARRIVSSLAAKPFLILAGLSGSGKTLLAISVARWLAAEVDQVRVVAVGADWTSTHHLLGYPDALDASRYVRTTALDLVVRALDNPGTPHFLILDEMNLSHVERYFSDFLSAMESTQPISLHGSKDARDDIDPSIDFPKNLFVIGTINVDETTYMFSPKVLDRGNVIEFTVSQDAMRAYLDDGSDFNSGSLQGRGASFAASLLSFVVEPASLDELSGPDAEAVRSAISAAFAAMNDGGMQFGFRTAREISRYVVASKKLGGSSWQLLAALDDQIAQRLLPKLSGDAAKLRPVLVGLLALLHAAQSAPGIDVDVNAMRKRRDAYLEFSFEDLQVECLALSNPFPLSGNKIGRMLSRLHESGFTTAIEA